jgi:hypothetical protein
MHSPVRKRLCELCAPMEPRPNFRLGHVFNSHRCKLHQLGAHVHAYRRNFTSRCGDDAGNLTAFVGPVVIVAQHSLDVGVARELLDGPDVAASTI